LKRRRFCIRLLLPLRPYSASPESQRPHEHGRGDLFQRGTGHWANKAGSSRIQMHRRFRRSKGLFRL